MIFDVELHCDKWKDCKTKWCNGDGGFWCKEDCKLLQVRPITRKHKVEKILSNSDAVYVLYADGTWRKPSNYGTEGQVRRNERNKHYDYAGRTT